MRAILVLMLMMAAPAFAEIEFHVIPFDVDPPIEIDGDLADWALVPNAIQLNDPKQATFGEKEYTGLDDMSGVIHIAWRPGGLFFAAQVVDDQFTQPYSGAGLYRGDHANLFIDLAPQQEPDRNAMGAGQYHIAVSPGSLASPDSGEQATPPEVFFYTPQEGMDHHGKCKVAAKRTGRGYIVEAYIPFELLGGFKAAQGKDVHCTVALSDGDGKPPKQDTFMTPTTKKWRYGRHALIPMVLGDGNGKGSPPARTVALLDEAIIPAQKSHTVTFNLDGLPKDKIPHVFFRGRVNHHRVGGYVANSMKIDVNGQVVSGKRITNRPQESTMMRGDVNTYFTNEGPFVLWYSPDYTAVEKHPDYALIDHVKACEFEFNLDGLIKAGANTLTFHNLAQDTPDTSRTATIGDVELRIKAPSIVEQLKPAPTGDIPTYQPGVPTIAWTKLSQSKTNIRFNIGDQSFAVDSRFTTPDGQWQTDSNKYYKHQRQVIERGEWIEVHDTFTNLTDENVPIIQENTCDLTGNFEKLWLSGVWMPSRQGRKNDPGNPSIYASTKSGQGVGLLALSDALGVHSDASADGKSISLSDRQFILRPKTSYTAKWSILPTKNNDFWAFINKARRMLDVNFKMDMLFAGMTGGDPVYKWSDQRFKSFIDYKDANFVVQSIYGPSAARWKGRNPYSTAFAVVDHTYYRDFHKRLRKFYPDKSVRHGIYYHCFIDNYDGNDVKFADARKLGPNGEHLNYGGRYFNDKLYVPTLDNAFGRETARNIDIIMDDIGADGIFWDEFCTSRGKYIYNMFDGVSADIDPKKFTINRLKGSVAILSSPWRAKQVRKIQSKGWLLCSGAPQTQATAQTKYLAFCETGSISHLRGMLLWTPIGLGDHISERTQRDAYKQMLRQLDHGGLYAWYSTSIIPTHKTLTEHMFPFTPIELHSGYLIGQERILTNRSGNFGWGDSSQFDVYVYDRTGHKTDKINVPRIERDGNAFAEVRIPEGYSAAIVRK